MPLLSPLAQSDRWPSQAACLPRTTLHPAWAAGLLHGVLLALAAGWVMRPVPVVQAPQGVELVFSAIDELGQARLAPPAPAPGRPSPARLSPGVALTIPTQPVRAAGVVARPVAVRRMAPSAAPAVREASAPALPTQGAAARVASQAAAAPVAPAAGPDSLLPGLEARIDSAVREAAVMPEAAKRQHRQGRARVRFTYVDGAVEGVALVVSSASGGLDEAAENAVRRASYPQPPASLRGRRLDLLIWIDFRNAA